MIRVINIDFKNVSLRVEVYYIRTQVFIFEQGVDPSLEYDEYDDVAHHYLAFKDETAVGTARWRETEKGIKLERFAVLQPYRYFGAGSAILEKLMHDVLPLSETIYLHSQITAVPFYEKHGFIKTGDAFYEAGIKHYSMVWSASTLK